MLEVSQMKSLDLQGVAGHTHNVHTHQEREMDRERRKQTLMGKNP